MTSVKIFLTSHAKCERLSITNVRTINAIVTHYGIPDHTIDFALMVSSLHEFSNKEDALREIKRILKPSSRLSVIELQENPNTNLPRLGPTEVSHLLQVAGFTPMKTSTVGNEHYGVVALS